MELHQHLVNLVKPIIKCHPHNGQFISVSSDGAEVNYKGLMSPQHLVSHFISVIPSNGVSITQHCAMESHGALNIW